MSNETVFALSDDAIATVVRIIQFGLLSGQDITDYFRSLRLREEDGLMVPDSDWIAGFEAEMVAANEQLIARAESTTETASSSNLN